MYAALTLFASVGVVLALFAGIAAGIEAHRAHERKARRATRGRHPSGRPRLHLTPAEYAAIRPATARPRGDA